MQTEQSPIDLAGTEWRLLGAVERYKAACAATGRCPNSLEAWQVFLAELTRGPDLRPERSPRRRQALAPIAAA